MFRDMRRSKQLLPKEEAVEILNRNTNGVLAVLGDDGYPYAVPMSYAYEDGVIYFHCAKAGHKIDAILQCPKASFSVVDRDEIVPQEFTTYFKSAIAFGKAYIVEDDERRRHALTLLSKKYSGEYIERLDFEIERFWKTVCIIELKVEHLTGKAAIELMR